LPDMGQDPDEDEGEPAIEEPPVAPRLAVVTRTSVEAEADAAAKLAAMKRRLMREMDAFKSREQSLVTQLAVMRGDQDRLVEKLVRANRDVGDLRTHVGQLIGRVQRVEGEAETTAPDVQAALDLVSIDMSDTKVTVERMKLQIGELSDKLDSGGGVSCHGLVFGSQKEFVRWYKQKNIANHAMFMDAVAVLHSISDAVVSDEQYNKTRESQTKNDFENSLESTMASSFNTMVPSGLIGGRLVKEGGAAAVQLKKCLSSFEIWEPAGMERGLSQEIVEGIGLVNQEVLEYQSNCTKDPEVRLLAQGLLGDSVNFCRELVLFVSVQNKHLTQGTKYTKGQVWSMQLDIILQILTELSKERRGLATSARKEPALYVWAMLKARAVQERLRGNKFEDDPSLNGIIMRKIMLQGGSEALNLEIKKIEVVDKRVTDNYRVNNSDIKSLQDRVSKLEKK
jgi:hypothetical protein